MFFRKCQETMKSNREGGRPRSNIPYNFAKGKVTNTADLSHLSQYQETETLFCQKLQPTPSGTTLLLRSTVIKEDKVHLLQKF